MATFTLDSYSIISKNASIAPQVGGTFNGSIGDEIEITLNYSFDEILTGDFWYNIGLFVESNETLVNSGEVPTSGFFINLPLGATTALNLGLRGSSSSEKNGTATIQKLSDYTFTIIHSLILTQDLNDWIQGSGYENTDRLFSSSTTEIDQFEEFTDSAYNDSNLKTFGFLVAIDRPVTTVSSNNGISGKSGGLGVQIDLYTADSPIFAIFCNAYGVPDKYEIFINGGTPVACSSPSLSLNNNGQAYGFDGNGGLGYSLYSAPSIPTIPSPNHWYIGTNEGTFNNRRADYIAETGDTNVPDNVNQQIVWVTGLSNGDEIAVRVSGTSGTKWNYKTYVPEMITQTGGSVNLHSFIDVELQFVQEDSTNREFNLTRNGVTASELATFADTDVEVNVDFSTLTLSKIRYSLLNISNENNNTDFLTNYKANFQDAPAPTQNSNTFTTNIIIPSSSTQIDNLYRIYCVGYDEAGNEVRAWCSDVLSVTDTQNSCPTISSVIDNYDTSYSTYYIKLSTVQRVKAKLEITETGSPITSLTLFVNGDTLTAFKSGTNWTTNDSRWTLTQIGSIINSEFNFRIAPEWENSTKDLVYNFTFGTETDAFIQRFEIEQNEQNKITPDLTNQKLYFNGSEISDFCGLSDGDFVEMQTTKDANYSARQTFHAWNDTENDIIEEEVWTENVLPQLSADGVQNVDENFVSDIATAEFAPYQILKGFVGVVTFETRGIFVKTFRFFSPELNQQTHTATESETITAINIIGALETDYTFQINGGTAQTFAQIQGYQLSNTDVLTINQVSGDFKDSSLNLEFAKSESVTSPFVASYTFPSNTPNFGSIDDDVVFSFSNLVNVTAINALGGADMYYAVRTGDYNAENWTLFPFDSHTQINTAINALSEGQKYSIHIFADWHTISKGTIQLFAEYQTADKEYIETKDFATDSQFRDLGGAWTGDGITDTISINSNLTGSKAGETIYDYIWLNKSFSISCLFFADNFTTDRFNFLHFATSDEDFELIRFLFFVNASSLVCNFVTEIDTVNDYQYFGIVDNHNIKTGEWNHIVLTRDGTLFPSISDSGVKFYVNGKKLDLTRELFQYDPAKITPYSQYNKVNILARESITEGDPTLPDSSFSAGKIADFAVFDRVLSSSEIWQMYKRGTNVPANYASHYPASVLADRVLHYPLNTGTFTGLQVNDETGNSTANIIGQVTPDLTPIYY